MKKQMSGLLAGIVLFLSVPNSVVLADCDTYTVSYRPGNVGYFGVSGTQSTDKKTMASEVATLLYAGNDDVTAISVTENGAIKLTVAKGAAVPSAPSAGYIQTQTGYVVKNASEWGAGSSETVVKNLDYVVDYGKLVNGVEYTVTYVDSVSGTQVASSAVAYGNVGDTIEIVAPSSLTISGSVKYSLKGTASKSLKLSSDSSKNKLEFTYTAKTVKKTNEIVKYVDGDTVTTINTNTIYTAGQTTNTANGGGAVLAAGQTDTENTAGDINEVNDNEANDNEMNDTEANDFVNIEDEDTPLGASDGSEENPQEIVEIEDEPTALSDSSNAEKGNTAAVGVTVSTVSLLGLGTAWFLRKRLIRKK